MRIAVALVLVFAGCAPVMVRPPETRMIVAVGAAPARNLASGCVGDYRSGTDYFPEKSRFTRSAQLAVRYGPNWKRVILTSQRDAGLRWRAAGDLKLVLGVFDVRKPYLTLDPTGLFTTLGNTRNRGIEASLSGTAAKGLSIALGAVLLDPQVTGAARRLGRTGKRPVGIPFRSVDLNIDWRLPGLRGVSIDTNVTEQGRVASTVDNRLLIPSRVTVDLGARYRFALAGSRAQLRVAVSNVLNRFAWDYAGPGTFDYVPGRLLTVYLAQDW